MEEDEAVEDGTMVEEAPTGAADVVEEASKGEEDEATMDKSHPHQISTTLERKQARKRCVLHCMHEISDINAKIGTHELSDQMRPSNGAVQHEMLYA